jgi:MprA protease rhombosortase-interaction domain-containing protein
MSTRRILSSTTLAFALAAAAAGPALGMPIRDVTAAAPQPEQTTVIREVPADGPDPTLAVVMSGAALLVAAGAAGYARHGRTA